MNKNVFLFLIYGILILVLGVFPTNVPKEFFDISIFFVRGDYFLHAFLFFPWMLLNPKQFHSVGTWFLLGLFVAITIEGVQFFIPYRMFLWSDLLANCIGVIVGLLIFLILKRIHIKRKKKRVYLFK